MTSSRFALWNTLHRGIFQNGFAGRFNNFGWHILKVHVFGGNTRDLQGKVAGQMAKTSLRATKSVVQLSSSNTPSL